MGYYCTVPQCTSLAGKTKNVKFHRFPRDQTMADKWNHILKRGKPYTKYSKVCSLHFIQGDYNITTMGKKPGQWKTLSKDAIPTQNLPRLNPDGTVMVIRKSRSLKTKSEAVSPYAPGYSPVNAANSTPVKREIEDSAGDKQLEWSSVSASSQSSPTQSSLNLSTEASDASLQYRVSSLNALANCISPQSRTIPQPKPTKQDAVMQTDPITDLRLDAEDDVSQNNSFSDEVPDNSYSEATESPYMKSAFAIYDQKEQVTYDNDPKDYSKETEINKEVFEKTNEDFINGAESYALERKPKHDNYDKVDQYKNDCFNSIDSFAKSSDPYKKSNEDFVQSEVYEKDETYQDTETYSKNSDSFEKSPTDSYVERYEAHPEMYPANYAAALLRNQQQNLQILQEQQRLVGENFFDQNIVKQELDMNDEDKFMVYEGSQMAPAGEEGGYSPQQRNQLLQQQQKLMEQLHQQHSMVAKNDYFERQADRIKTEPEMSIGCETTMQPQQSPLSSYYPTDVQTEVVPVYYEPRNGLVPQQMLVRQPGAELLIAKQNALAAHTQLWQNTVKRPFFYSEPQQFNSAQLLQSRFELQDLTRLLQNQ